jgi:hypothetical protein
MSLIIFNEQSRKELWHELFPISIEVIEKTQLTPITSRGAL